jgi:copper(I)-binding protein
MSTHFSRHFSTPRVRTALAATCLALLSPFVLAQGVEIKNAWARATVPGQMATGAFMTLTSGKGTRLKSVASPVAGVSEVHEMRMDGDVMKMAALKDGLNLPAGKKVELKPGSFHLMLMDLKAPLQKDTMVPLTLTFVDAKGAETKTELNVPVKTAAPMAHMH